VVLERHGSVQNDNAVNNFWELFAQIANESFKDVVAVFVGQLLERGALQIDDDSDLVHDAFCKVFALFKLISPCVLHLLQEEFGNYIWLSSLHQVTGLQLADLHVEDRAAGLVDLVEARGHEFFDRVVLQEIVLQNEVHLIELSPSNPAFHLTQSLRLVKTLGEEQSSVDRLLEKHLINVVEYLRFINCLDKLLHLLQLVFAQ